MYTAKSNERHYCSSIATVKCDLTRRLFATLNSAFIKNYLGFKRRVSLRKACVCLHSLPILTAGEDERTGVFVHWEIMELQLAFCVDGHPGEGEKCTTAVKVSHLSFGTLRIHIV